MMGADSYEAEEADGFSLWAEGKKPLCVGENTKDKVLTSVANHCVFLKESVGPPHFYFLLFWFLVQLQSADIRIYVKHSVSVTYSPSLKNHDMRMS